MSACQHVSVRTLAYRDTVFGHRIQRLTNTICQASQGHDQFGNDVSFSRAMSGFVIDVKHEPCVLADDFYFANPTGESIDDSNGFDQRNLFPVRTASHDLTGPVHTCHRAAHGYYMHQTRASYIQLSENNSNRVRVTQHLTLNGNGRLPLARATQ